MLDEFDGWTFPVFRVLEVEIVAIEPQKMPHRAERSSLVALLKCMRLSNRGQISDGKNDDIFFAISESVLWACQRPFEQTHVSEEVALAGFLHLKPVLLDY